MTGPGRRHDGVVPSATSSARARRDVERLAAAPGEPDAFFAGLVALLGEHGVRAVGACWHLTDPETGLFTWTGATGELPGDFAGALHNEFGEDDVAKYADLARRPAPVAGLVAETGGAPRRSLRFREQLAPDGFADELRIAFVDGFGRWGSLGLFGEAAYTPGQAAEVARLVPLVAGRLRREVGRAGAAAPDGEAPGVLLLDAQDRVRLHDARAGELLEGRARTGALPGAIHVLAARARAAGAPAHGRTRTGGGGWLAVDASPVVEERGAVAVVLRPAGAPSLLDVRLRAAGLTDREREVARAVLRGASTAEIAAALHLSPWTVQDHLKAVFEKCGVRSRRAFVASWALAAAP